MHLSVIIPAHNEEKNIAKTISFIKTSIPDKIVYEIIVICDSCSDKTKQQANHANIVCEVNFTQRYKTRNHGAGLASGYLLLFVDADTLVSRYAIESAMQLILNKNTSLVGSCMSLERPAPVWTSGFEIICNTYLTLTHTVPGLFMMCRRAHFNLTKGFPDDHLEDIVFANDMQQFGAIKKISHGVVSSARRGDSMGLIGVMMHYCTPTAIGLLVPSIAWYFILFVIIGMVIVYLKKGKSLNKEIAVI